MRTCTLISLRGRRIIEQVKVMNNHLLVLVDLLSNRRLNGLIGSRFLRLIFVSVKTEVAMPTLSYEYFLFCAVITGLFNFAIWRVVQLILIS